MTTIDDWSPGEIYRTTNGGASWAALVGAASWDVAGAEWLYWHGSSAAGEGLDGRRGDRSLRFVARLFITGSGPLVERRHRRRRQRRGDALDVRGRWSRGDGGARSRQPSAGRAIASTPPLLTGVGDIGGFRHDDLTVSPPGGMFDNPIFGNTNSLDFAESAPAIVARVGTNSSSGEQNGAYSMDGGATWIAVHRSHRDQQRQYRRLRLGRIDCRLRRRRDVRLGSRAEGLAVAAAVVLDATTAPPGPPAPGSAPACWSPPIGSTPPRSTRGTAGQDDVREHRRRRDIHRGPDHARPAGRGRCSAWRGTSGSRPRSGLLHSQDAGATFASVPGVNGATAVGFGAPVLPGQTYPSVYLAGSAVTPRGELRLGDLPLRRRGRDLAAHRRSAAPVRLHQLPGRRSAPAGPRLSRHVRERHRLWRPANGNSHSNVTPTGHDERTDENGSELPG